MLGRRTTFMALFATLNPLEVCSHFRSMEIAKVAVFFERFLNVQLVVDDARRAKKALDESGLTYQETPAEEYELPNKPGALAQYLEKLTAKGINLNSICATAAKGGKKAVVVYTVDVKAKAASATA